MNETNTSIVVLVVDDSPESLGMLNMALGQAGFTVLVALSGIQALSIIDKIEPDVILLDAIMPEMDGFETCGKLKLALPAVPVIFMTGLSDEEHIVSGFSAGGVDYITKPIKPSEVIARIKVHVNNARVTQSTQAALDTTGKHVLSLNNQGNIIWSTQQAHTLLSLISGAESTLQDEFRQQLIIWLRQKTNRENLIFSAFSKPITLSYLSAQNDNEHLVQLSELAESLGADDLVEALSITKREADVLLWISRGKTNREIAQILKISPRTVNKHLESLFIKLEVDNRTAAAAICIPLLKT